jgi:hypothetical protein
VVDSFIPAGAGGNDLNGNKKQKADQTLTDVNRSMLGAMALRTPVRALRRNDAAGTLYGSALYYDGLYYVVSD